MKTYVRLLVIQQGGKVDSEGKELWVNWLLGMIGAL